MRALYTTPLAAVAAVLFLAADTAHGLFGAHSQSSSQYIHSNDTISLTLDSRQGSSLHGAPGSMQNLQFILINNGLQGHFTISQSSEDGFLGILNTREAYLASGQQQTITVSNMRVPERPDESKIRFTLKVVKDSGTVRRRRDAQQNGGGQQQGGYNGNDPYNRPNGGYPPNNNYPNNNNNNNNMNNNNRPGMNRPGGIGGIGGIGQFMDPSYRRDLSITVEFTVADELEDDDDPWIKLYYGAEDDGETCMYEPGDPNCENDYWWVKFRISEEGDEESGLSEINIVSEGENMYGTPIYYRYPNFPLGTVLEQEVVAAASCCVEKMLIRVTDVAGNMAEEEATNGGTGAKLTTAEIWGVVGGVLAFVLLVALVFIIVCCCCKEGKCSGSCGGCGCCGYDSVSSG